MPVAIGLILAAGVTMAQAAHGHGVLPLLVVAAVATLVVWRTEYSPLWTLGAGGLLGVLLF